MNPKRCIIPVCLALFALAPVGPPAHGARAVKLPAPSFKGEVSVEEALRARRTHRSFSGRSLTARQLSQILWAAYGVTKKVYGRDLKTAPSAGALYPIDIYVVAGKGGVEDLLAGAYLFRPADHSLELIKEGELREKVARGALGQMWMAGAPIMLVITGEYSRSTLKYGPRGITYTHIEAGCVGENVFLQAEALGLCAGIVGAFESAEISEAIGADPNHDPLLIMPVGYPSTR